MKTYFLSIALILVISIGNAQDNGQTITVEVNNVVNNNGKVIFGLHTEDTFMKAESIQSAESEIKDGKVNATFKNVQP